MNWPERLFLGAVLLVAGAGILLALRAVGVPVPILAEHSPEAQPVSVRDDRSLELPPAAPPEEEPGLLEELGAGSPWAGGPLGGAGGDPAAGAASAAPGAGPGDAEGGGAPEEAGGKKAGRDPLVDRLLAKVDLSDPGQVMAFLIATFTPRGTKLGEEDVDLLLKVLAEQKQFGLRNLLMAHLERIGGEKVTEGILAFLATDPDPASAARALHTLGVQKDERAVEGLVGFLAETKNRRLREAAFRNLLGTRNPAATGPLLDVLDRAQDPGLKRYALAALSQLGGEQGAEAVLRYATSPDPLERSLGQRSLRDLRSPAAVPVLTDALARGVDPPTTWQVIRALGRIRDVRAVEPLGRLALEETNRGLRIEAIKGLGQIGRAEAVPTLRSIAESDKNPAVRRMAERAIQAIRRQEARRLSRPPKSRKPRKPPRPPGRDR